MSRLSHRAIVGIAHRAHRGPDPYRRARAPKRASTSPLASYASTTQAMGRFIATFLQGADRRHRGRGSSNPSPSRASSCLFAAAPGQASPGAPLPLRRVEDTSAIVDSGTRPGNHGLGHELQTTLAREVVDITERVAALVGGATGGSCHLFLRHTTAGLMVVTSETGVAEDIMDILQTLTPSRAYRHDQPAHVAAHFLSALVGPSVQVPVRNGTLALGDFQRIVLMEFEGPRRREIELRLPAAQ